MTTTSPWTTPRTCLSLPLYICNIWTRYGVVDVDCDYDQTSLNIKFDSNAHVLDFVARIVAGGSFKIFVTSKFNFSSCKSLDLTLVRRVVSAEPDQSNRVNVQLKAIVAHYDELIQDGTISLTPSGPCAPAVDQRFCVGLNVNDECADAKAPIAIYSNPFISLTCADCFTAFVADAFLVVKLSNWKVRPARPPELIIIRFLYMHSLRLPVSSFHVEIASLSFRLYRCRLASRTCLCCPML
jgi:hypothetical protein